MIATSGRIVLWEFAEYAPLVAAARAEGMQWHVAVLLAGEAGPRLGRGARAALGEH